MLKVLVVLFMLILASGASAQLKGFSLGPYAEVGWPTGEMQSVNKQGIGAGLGADIRLGRWGLTGSAGFMRFGGKTVGQGDGSMKMPAVTAIPVRAGIKYRLVPGLYAKLESGVARFTGVSESAIIFSPGVAVRLLGFELQAKYEHWNRKESLSFWGVKAGINF
jgi:hypothetical protein